MMRRFPLMALVAATLVAACGGTATTTGTATVSPPPNSELLTAGTLTIGSDVSYPPQEFFPTGSTDAQGFDIDVGKALAAKMGLRFAVINQAFDGIIPALDAKKYDVIISAMTINDARKQKVDFIPYFVAGESFVVAKNATVHPAQLADLCGKKVAAESGTAELDEANGLNAAGATCASNKIQISTFQTDTEALAQLKKGAVDIHFTDSPVASYEVLKDSNLAISGGVIEVAPEGIAVRKGDSGISGPVQKAFDAMKADGTYANILKTWNVTSGDIAKAPAA